MTRSKYSLHLTQHYTHALYSDMMLCSHHKLVQHILCFCHSDLPTSLISRKSNHLCVDISHVCTIYPFHKQTHRIEVS